jgi:ActR/RegA family two-component response regulator
MTIHGNALLVDDEPSWSEVYERAMRRVGIETVRIARSYEDAASEIDSMRFAIALVDIGLREHDDRNVDGLRVLEKIRATGDRTSVIVITGRSGGDVLPIVRDAIKKFNAFDTIAKGTLVPAELRALIGDGLRLYELGSGDDKKPLYEALRGDMDQMVWDDMLMRKAVTSGGAHELYGLINSLFTPFAPLLSGEPGGVRIENDDLGCGVFWSRGIGAAIVACFGQPDRVTSAMAAASADGLLLGQYRVGELAGEYSSPAAKGAIYRLEGHPRSVFR